MHQLLPLADDHAEHIKGGASDNIPNGFFNTTTENFSNGVYHRVGNAGGYDVVTYIPGGEIIAYERGLPNGKVLNWG